LRHRFLLLLLLLGCDQKMREQPRLNPLEPSRFFEDGQSARPLERGTVARHRPAASKPPMTRENLLRGRERFNIYCAVCHGESGYGRGPIVERGYLRPPSFHIDRLRSAPDEQIYDVITHGFGAMPSYAKQVSPEDRWRIVAYLRALQFSQHATLKDVPAGRLEP
jgi:mono/diheme cytochrome c family protein